MTAFPRLLAGLPVLLLSSAAAAQETTVTNGYDVDIDLVRPMFAPEVLPGFDVPDNRRGGTVRWGLALQYSRNPLVLYEFDEEVGPVVANRTSAWLGVSVDISRAFTARLTVPAHFQWGSTVPRYASDGFAIGDLNAGVHWAFFRRPTFGMGIRADIALPTSRRNFYAGERNPRFNPALMLMADAGKFRWVSDIGVNIRVATVPTTEEFSAGQELLWNNGFRYTVLREQLAVGLSFYSRFGFSNFFGAAESTGEALLNVAYGPVTLPGNFQVTANLAGGRGFTRGYSSSDFRTHATLVFGKIRPPRPGDEDFVDPDGEQGAEGDQGLQFNVREIGQVVGEGKELTDEPEWEEGELARIDRETERIRIRYAIRFKVNTNQLLPESIPTLDYVATILNNDARIAHVVVEGHASSDGEYAPNYTLSVDRARAIWEHFLESGVHPSRVSIRGMGEVVPAEATGGFDELQASRRVVFHIVDQLEEWESPPEFGLDLRYPWNGKEYTATKPRMPAPGEELVLPDFADPGAPQEDTLEDVDFSEGEEPEDFDMDGGEAPTPPPAPPDDGEDSETSDDDAEETP